MAARPKPIETGPRRTLSSKVEAAVGRAERSDRVMSLTAAQSVIGVDRGTLSRWIKKGCPVVAGGGTGKAVEVDLRDVWSWREEQVRKEERERFIRIDEDEDALALDADAEFKREQMKLLRVKIAKETGVLVHRPTVEMIFSTAMNAIRQTIIGISNRQERQVQGWPKPMVKQLKDDTLNVCRSALREAQAIMERDISKLVSGRLVELGVEPEIDPTDPDEDASDD